MTDTTPTSATVTVTPVDLGHPEKPSSGDHAAMPPAFPSQRPAALVASGAAAQNTLTRYLTALLPLGIAILGVLDAARATGTALLGWQTILQLVILVATTGAAYWLPLVPGRWAGRWKTGAAIVGAVASALIATVPAGHFTTATLILFLTAALKAVATEVGVQIRVDAAKVDAPKHLAGS